MFPPFPDIVSGPPARPQQSPLVLSVPNAQDLIALVPYLLGFHPQRSLVAVLIRDDQMRATVRFDLSLAGDPRNLCASIDNLVDEIVPDWLSIIGYTGAANAGGKLPG